jgi:hypothetical protein
VWSNVAWSNVLRVPVRNAIKNQLGNWVLITTRLEDLALQTGASFYQYHVSPLNEDDTWLLLNKQLPPTPGHVSEHIPFFWNFNSHYSLNSIYLGPIFTL